MLTILSIIMSLISSNTFSMDKEAYTHSEHTPNNPLAEKYLNILDNIADKEEQKEKHDSPLTLEIARDSDHENYSSEDDYEREMERVMQELKEREKISCPGNLVSYLAADLGQLTKFNYDYFEMTTVPLSHVLNAVEISIGDAILQIEDLFRRSKDEFHVHPTK